MDDQHIPSPESAMPVCISGSETITIVEDVPPITLNWMLSDSVLKTEVILENGIARSSSVVELPVDDFADDDYYLDLADEPPIFDRYPDSSGPYCQQYDDHRFTKPERIEGTESVTVIDGYPPITLNWVISQSTLMTEIVIENGSSRSSSVIELPIANPNAKEHTADASNIAGAVVFPAEDIVTTEDDRITGIENDIKSNQVESANESNVQDRPENDARVPAQPTESTPAITATPSPEPTPVVTAVAPSEPEPVADVAAIPNTEPVSSNGENAFESSQIEDPALHVLPIQPISMQEEFNDPYESQVTQFSQSPYTTNELPSNPQTFDTAQIPQTPLEGNGKTVEPVIPPIPQSSVIDEAARNISIPTEKPGKEKKKKKRHPVRNTIIGIILAILIYEIGGFVIGPLVLPYSDVGTIPLSETFGQSTTTSERVLYLGNDNEAALDWRLNAIQDAQSELCFESFDLRSDESSQDLMAAMYAAAERGVHERIIVDGFTALLKLKFDPTFAELYNHPNVEIKFYNMPNFLAPWTLNYRLHEKVITIDNTFAIVGGRNSMNYFLGDYGDKKKDDRDVLVYNTDPNSEVFAKISGHFNDYWNYKECTDANPWATPSQTLKSRWEKITANNPSITAATAWETITFPIEDIDFITCGTEATNKTPTLWKSICDICAKGSNVIIQTPYVMFSNEMYADLTALSMNRKVYVVTNDITDHTNAFGTMDLTHERGTILGTGVTLVETQWPAFVHAKAFIVDDDISLIGSFNCDSRSAYLDNECMLVIKSKALNEQLRKETSDSLELGYVQTSTSAVAGSKYDMQKRENNSIIWTIGGYITHPIRYLF